VPELTFDIAHTGPLNPIRDWVFPLVGDSSAVLHSSLLIGAVNNPSFSHGEKGASRILIQKGKTISLINQGLQKGQAALKDDVLYAVAAIALSEDRLGNHAACRTHLDGLRHMIKLRGGIKSLRKNAVLCAALMWAEVSVSNHVVPMARSQSSNEAPRGAKMSNLLMLETRYEEEIFCQFLTRLQRVQLSKRRSHLSVDHHTPRKTDFLFQKGSPLLTMLGDPGLDSGVITPISRLNAYNCQIACLFYINLMLCDFHGFPHLIAAFLARLSSLVCEHNQKKIPRASLFVWIFVKELENDDSDTGEMDRLDWLIRMIRATRRLSQESVQMLHQALLESLRTHESVDSGMRVSNDLGILASRIKMGSY
jgi:Fungal specific transcription factor domain